MKQKFVVAAEEAGERLDLYVASRLPELSRTRVQELVEEGLVLVNGRQPKSAHRVRVGERVQVEPLARAPLDARAEDIPLDVLYEDEDVLVVNKPAGMIVHAGAGRSTGTLVNALLGRGQGLSTGGGALRPGIVHRLDRETSGAILVAKDDAAHAKLAEQFRKREVKKVYLALVEGLLEQDHGRIVLAIARDRKRRVRMAPVAPRRAAGTRAREAQTDWRRLAALRAPRSYRGGGFTLVEVQLHTGRTHQIRVHFAALRHPVVGDTLYGAAKPKEKGGLPAPKQPGLGRNFLHAAKLGFRQPRTGKWIEVTAPLPQELTEYLHRLTEALGHDASEIDARISGYL